MSWLRIDDGFEDNAKVELISDAAHRLWMRAACWCKKTENAHLEGFVPKALLEVIAKRSAPLPKLLKLAQELVNANAAGTKEHGLWEPVDGGWKFHDWWRYQPSKDEDPNDNTPRAKSEAGRLGGKRSAEVRKSKHGTAQPKRAEANPEAQSEADSRSKFEAGASEAEPEAPSKHSEAPVPVPDPDQPDTTTQGPDRSGASKRSGVVVAMPDRMLPVAERARKVLENPHDGQYLQPSTWPEVASVAAAWSFGLALKLRDFPPGDSDLRAILEAFRDGYSVEQLIQAGERAQTSEHFAKLRHKGPSSFTAAVLRRLLNQPSRPTQGSDSPTVTPLSDVLADLERRTGAAAQ